MACANRSGLRARSGTQSSSCVGACRSSSLCFVSSDGHVEMKWGHLQVVRRRVYKTIDDIVRTRRVAASLPVTPRAESAGIRLKAVAAKEKADPEIGSSG